MAGVQRRGLTEQQARALAARGVSVALSAGAGCGKTFVLTERFLAELEPPPDGASPPARIHELVAITFTERAAREMRQRIRTACRRRALESPPGQAAYWQNLIRELDSARISTIHSFCGKLLRALASEARLDPQFQILDQTLAETLLLETLDDELRSRLVAQDETVLSLSAEFGLEKLRRMAIGLVHQRHKIDWPQWRVVTPETLVVRWHDHWRHAILPAATADLAGSPEAQAVLHVLGRCEPHSEPMRERCLRLRDALAALAAAADPLALLSEIRQCAKVRSGGGQKAWPSEQAYAEFRGAAAALRRAIDAAQPQIEFDPSSAQAAAETGLRLLALAEDIVGAYDARKQQLGALDFDDLLIRTRDLLAAPEQEKLRRRLASQTALLLVDEFQDTDSLQVELIEALSGRALDRDRLFFVGDYKQSIYRFRGADPHVFQRLREATPPEGRLPLSLNFRSQGAILAFVNALFCDEFAPDYDPLVPQRPALASQPAIEFLWAADAEPETRSGQGERLRRREADFLARRIRQLLDDGEPLVGDAESAARGSPRLRAVRPGDVAILFRALSDVQYYEEALQRHGIDYYLVGGHAFYAQQEVFDLVNLLRAVASAADEVSLVGALRSPIFSVEDESLFWLARHPQGLAAGLFGPPPVELSATQRRRVEFAARTLAELRALKDRIPVAALIQWALERTGYDAVLLAEFMGTRKLANLHKLIDQARSFDRPGMFTLADFITQLSEFVARQPDEPLAATHPETTDVVRLMTIHQAKGLEFPLVAVPDLDRRMHGSPASVAFTPELGPCVRMSDGSSGFDLHAFTEKAEEQAELVRLLYVATTRAADYLILSSSVTALSEARGPWMQLLCRRFDPLTGKLRVALPEGYELPQVRVTTTAPPLASSAGRRPPRHDLLETAQKALQASARRRRRAIGSLDPVPADAAARRLFSFSRLSGMLHQADVAATGDNTKADLSSILSGDAAPPRAAIDPLGLGSLVHAVLERIDFANPGDLRAAVARLADEHLPGDSNGIGEAAAMIERFVRSPRAAGLAAARQVHRELEFLLRWPPESAPDADGIYLQGYLDCLYEDAAGCWHLLDYKTNRASKSMLERAAAPYEMQMLVYALAVETITGKPPDELVLYFLRPGAEYSFTWDAAARRRLKQLLEPALATAVAGPSRP